jgi:RNA-binding protein
MTSPNTRELKSRSQLLKPFIHVGRDGLSEKLLAALDQALSDHELVKVRFTEFKEQRKQLAAEMAERTGSRPILQVGHTVTLYRQKPPREQVG